MPTVAHRVDELVRERPGDVDTALMRLVQVRYIRRVRTGNSRTSYYPIEGPRD
jgi:hypothetical protein